ncbi:decaprenyl-diphosphate synthase subunit 2-like [Asterias rubens]|uniref:decaprenyl-diphosphate synthase subunit 2-like n=1 Tax=Asterias rubens TaxID=7604 RepID=UPI001455CC17|nr:decaprenyl-diphosphate synthase subunit 2-like [Asterias rubens]
MSLLCGNLHRYCSYQKMSWNLRQITATAYQRTKSSTSRRNSANTICSTNQKNEQLKNPSVWKVELSEPTPAYLPLTNTHLTRCSRIQGDSSSSRERSLNPKLNESKTLRSHSWTRFEGRHASDVLNIHSLPPRNHSSNIGSSSQMKAGLQFFGSSLNHVSVIPSRGISLFGLPERSAWSLAIAEAEKIVGYPTSFIGLRCLLSDELSNVAMHVRKLVGTKHPLVKTAKNFVYDGKHNIQTRGLIVLLISKAAGPSPRDTSKQSMVRGIYPSQRTLAEIAEMIHTAFLVHKGIVDIKDLIPTDGPRSVMEFGNKIAVLSGDFLLASACSGLAQLRNTHVVDLVSQSISDLTQATFMSFSEELGSKGSGQLLPNVGIADWAKYVYLSSGSLIAKSCRAALELAGHGEEMQKCAFEFGKNIALAQQLNQELLTFTSFDGSDASFSLTSAPVLLHLESSKNRDRFRNQTTVDIKKLHRDIQSGSAITKSKELCRTYGESARVAISVFPESDAKNTLEQMVNAVTL